MRSTMFFEVYRLRLEALARMRMFGTLGMAYGGIAAKLRERRGSLALEAAIFLPLFLVAVLTLGYLIILAGSELGATHVLTDESRKLAIEAPFRDSSAVFKKDVLARIDEEERYDVENAGFSSFMYRVSGVTKGGRLKTDLLVSEVSYDIPLKIPHIFKDRIPVSVLVIGRAFVGKTEAGAPMSFDEMERDEEGRLVWVFPRSGTKYHGENCRYISNEAREAILTRELAGKYRPCKICNAPKYTGHIVYYFVSSGEVYHRADCDIVEKYVISMSERDAIERGYGPCSVCGGR